MPLGPSEVGLASVSAAVTLAAIKTIDYLVRHRNGKNGKNGNQTAVPLCRAQDCNASQVTDRIQEYHEENRQVLRDIRDGIKLLAVLMDKRSGPRKD